jgi:hypothetical protein
MLAPDPAHPEVTVTLPKIKLSLEQTAGTAAGADPQMTVGFDSWAAHDIDDPAGAGFGELASTAACLIAGGEGAGGGTGVSSTVSLFTTCAGSGSEAGLDCAGTGSTFGSAATALISGGAGAGAGSGAS